MQHRGIIRHAEVYDQPSAIAARRILGLMQQGRVVSIKDETIPWFDFEKIYNENANNLIGLFIKKVYHMPMDETRRERILSYGLQAMYHGRGENGRCG